MSPEQFKNLETTISNQIKTTVNGKIDRMNEKLDHYIINDDKWKADVNKWQDDVKPYIENMRQFCDFGAVGSTILKSIIVIGGAVGVIYGFIKYLK